MPVTAIDTQPGAIVAAYSNIIFEVTAQNENGSPAPDAVDCDVFINGNFYQRHTRNRYKSTDGVNTVWDFQVQDDVQRFLSTGYPLTDSILLTPDPLSSCSVECHFRAYTKDGNGLITPEDSTLNSSSFKVVNSSIDGDNFLFHLNSIKMGEWSAVDYPLSHRLQNYKVCRSDTDAYPILLNSDIAKIRLNYMVRLDNMPRVATVSVDPQSGLVMYLPTGPVQLAYLFSDANNAPETVNFNQVSSYSVQAINAAGSVIATTPMFKIGGCCDDDKVRILFRNALGTMDAINLQLVKVPVSIKSSLYQISTLESGTHALNRYGVDIDRVYVCNIKDYSEKDQFWIEELLSSTLAWADQGNGYLPIVILDGNFDLVKDVDRFDYQGELQFRYDRKRMQIRN